MKITQSIRKSSLYAIIWAILFMFQHCANAPLIGDTLVAGSVSYLSHIQPMFNAYCGGCHLKTPGAGGLSLLNHAALMQGGNSGPSVVVGTSAQSLLIKRLNGSVSSIMPAEGTAFTANQIKNIANWIDQGALDN